MNKEVEDAQFEREMKMLRFAKKGKGIVWV